MISAPFHQLPFSEMEKISIDDLAMRYAMLAPEYHNHDTFRTTIDYELFNLKQAMLQRLDRERVDTAIKKAHETLQLVNYHSEKPITWFTDLSIKSSKTTGRIK
jgi:hypothetical protein